MKAPEHPTGASDIGHLSLSQPQSLKLSFWTLIHKVRGPATPWGTVQGRMGTMQLLIGQFFL
jgi:hypothetical protein